MPTQIPTILGVKAVETVNIAADTDVPLLATTFLDNQPSAFLYEVTFDIWHSGKKADGATDADSDSEVFIYMAGETHTASNMSITLAATQSVPLTIQVPIPTSVLNFRTADTGGATLFVRKTVRAVPLRGV